MWPQTLEAMGIVKNKLLIKLLDSLFNQLYKSFDKVLLGSKGFEKIACGRTTKKKIEYFPNWAEHLFENLNLQVNPPKPDSKIVITYTGNIGEAQGLDILIKAIKHSGISNLEFNFIGSGRFKKKLKKLVLAHNLETVFTFFDPVTSKDLIPFFKKTHYLFLSLKKTKLFSMTVPAKLQTYLATGKPIISFISGEARDLLVNNNCGINVDSDDRNTLIETFQNLDKISYTEYVEFSQNSSKLYKEEFSSHKRITQLHDILSEK